MFLNNKYTSWYWSIITRAQLRVLCVPQYTERHHIVPRCMGGSNAKSNLVILTAKEHYIVHLLLPRMVQGQAKYKMQVAFWRMCSHKDGRHIPSTTAYERAKQNMATALSALYTGKPLPTAQREAMKGKPAHNKGKKMPTSHGVKISEYRKRNPNHGKNRSSNKGKPSPNKGKPRPKFSWVLQNKLTLELNSTTNLKNWCKIKSFSDVAFYKGRTDWIILEKYKLSDNSRII